MGLFRWRRCEIEIELLAAIPRSGALVPLERRIEVDETRTAAWTCNYPKMKNHFQVLWWFKIDSKHISGRVRETLWSRCSPLSCRWAAAWTDYRGAYLEHQVNTKALVSNDVAIAGSAPYVICNLRSTYSRTVETAGLRASYAGIYPLVFHSFISTGVRLKTPPKFLVRHIRERFSV